MKKKCIMVIRIWHESHMVGAIAYKNKMIYDRDTEYVKIALVEQPISEDESSANQIFYRHS